MLWKLDTISDDFRVLRKCWFQVNSTSFYQKLDELVRMFQIRRCLAVHVVYVDYRKNSTSFWWKLVELTLFSEFIYRNSSHSNPNFLWRLAATFEDQKGSWSCYFRDCNIRDNLEENQRQIIILLFLIFVLNHVWIIRFWF